MHRGKSLVGLVIPTLTSCLAALSRVRVSCYAVLLADPFPPVVQRPKLLELAEALDSRSDALRRDEHIDWRISGKFGHVGS